MQVPFLVSFLLKKGLRFVIIYISLLLKGVAVMKIKRLKAAVCMLIAMVLLLSALPLTAYATSTNVAGAQGHELENIFTGTFTDGYDSTIFIYATPGAYNPPYTNYTMREFGGNFGVPQYDSEQWFFAGWRTWYKGSHSGAGVINSDKANPEYDDKYNYFNQNADNGALLGSYPQGYMTVFKEYYWDGTYYLSAIYEPLVTVNAGEGITYAVSEATKRANNKYSTKYNSGMTINYNTDNKYVVTSVSANYGTDYSNNNSTVTLSSIIRPATISINSRLKQQKVNYNANGGSETMTTQTFDYGESQKLTKNSFMLDGCVFTGWNTKADGTGESYTDEQSVVFSPQNDGDSITLYAQWKLITPENSYKIENGRFDGTRYWYRENATVNVEASQGYTISTEYNGTYGERISFSETDTKVFYLKRTSDGVRSDAVDISSLIAFDKTLPEFYGIENGGIYYGDKVFKTHDDNIYEVKVDGTPVTDLLNGDGEYKIIADNSEHVIIATDKAGNSNQYTVKVLTTYTVRFDANGGTGTMQDMQFKYDEAQGLTPNAFSREGYTFIGWRMDTHPTLGTAYFEDELLVGNLTEVDNDTVILYATWEINTYNVTFKADGKIVDTQTVEYGKDAVLPSVPEKDGYTGEWNSNGKFITSATVIEAVYTENSVEVPAVPQSPKTGDNSNMWLWGTLVLGCSLVLMYVFIKKIKAIKN